MAIATSRITAQGQVSIPAEVRRRLGVGPGSILEWNEQGSEVVVRRAARATSEEIHRKLFARRPVRPRSLAELDAGKAKRIKRRHARH